MRETFEELGDRLERDLVDIKTFLEEGQEPQAEEIVERLLTEDKENYDRLRSLSQDWGSDDPSFGKMVSLLFRVDKDLRERGVIVTEMPPTLPPPPDKDEPQSSIKIKGRRPSKDS